ncbi:MAG TPA: hypothetical protein VNK95_07610, partial [Caldilineaceae bacterium]|nr:hypothetical protein [Caldilineaceae bacterium]
MTEQQAQTALCWQALGAWTGGSVLSVAAAQAPHGGIRVLAATRAGLFRWEFPGEGWQPARQGLTDPSLVAVTFAGAAVNGWPAAFAASASGRLFRSDDGGLVWREVTAWAGLGVATALAASPAFHEDGILFAGASEGFFRTLDGGESWESCSFGLLDAEALCLACAPDFAASQLLWAGTAGGGLYRSRNQARAWRESGMGLPDAAVQALAVSPTFADDRTLYAGLEGHGVYRSRDGGESWTPCGPALAAHSINTLICAGSAAHLVAGADAGLFWSNDGGDHWQAAEGAAFAALALTYAGGEIVVAGAFQGGVMLSTDGGRRWSSAPPLVVHAPPVISAASDRLAALDIDG